jgi:hypothetical protein
MSKVLAALIAAMVLGCGAAPEGEPVASEELALPVQAAAPCIRVTCDQATCNGTLTVTQTVPANIGRVEVWDASQWSSTPLNHTASTMVTQSPGQVVTTTRVSGFARNDYFCLLTSVVTRNAAGNVVGSAPVVNGQLSLQPSAVTATVAP